MVLKVQTVKCFNDFCFIRISSRWQACDASQATVQTGAHVTPDDGGRVEGPGRPTESRVDPLHDPQTR